MNTKKVLIVCDSENQHYWSSLTNKIKEKIGTVSILMDKDYSQQKINHPYDVIVMDISNIEDLHSLIPKIHHEQPGSRILIVCSTPTWKQTREVIRLGAANLISKSSNMDQFIHELRPL